MVGLLVGGTVGIVGDGRSECVVLADEVGVKVATVAEVEVELLNSEGFEVGLGLGGRTGL